MATVCVVEDKDKEGNFDYLNDWFAPDSATPEELISMSYMDEEVLHESVLVLEWYWWLYFVTIGLCCVAIVVTVFVTGILVISFSLIFFIIACIAKLGTRQSSVQVVPGTLKVSLCL